MTEPYSPSASASGSPEKPARRPYTKPSIVRVELRAEEAVLGACKTASTAGPASPQCTTLACSSIAS
ncbi:hypothetical protein [Chloracidobacterium thermophilum]|uniref:hypothetical protein n=1 Tax=Chloracidobacterium thermophilum TaxID=458033 RepID=UPI0012FEC6C4|nr:hypothetical protein [Chloracidobacterium thermophilum]